jgi:hypothetical protein
MAGSFIDGGGDEGVHGDEPLDDVEIEVIEPVGGILGCLQFMGLLAKLALLLGVLVIILAFVVALVTSV